MSRLSDDIFYQLSEVTEYLLLGGAPAVTVERVRAHGVTCIINAAQLPNLPVDSSVSYFRVPVDDVPTANLAAYFDSVADAVERHRRRGGRTLIHCVAGVSRSAALVLAHQVKHAQLTLRQAFLRLRQRRPVVRPNAGFFQQLIEFERRVRGSASVRMVRQPTGGGAELIPDVYEPEYRRAANWAEWLRHKNLGNRVSVFRPPRGTKQRGAGEAASEAASREETRRQQAGGLLANLASLASSLQKFSLGQTPPAVGAPPAS